jgi:hypothetical protein
MKFVVAAAALALTASPLVAAELGNTGISLGGEAVAEFNIDAENLSLVVTPEVSYNFTGFFVASAATDLTIYDGEFTEATFEVLPIIDFRVEREVMANLTAYGEMSYDLEAKERGDATVGVSFNF